MAESEISSLKGFPSYHYDIMQKIYAELDQEREASATAANEALSMILRLQGEKATEMMEACQYKRMAEEKIHHAEESLAMFEEALHQKDMEIAHLKFQVQIYRDKLSKKIKSSSLMEMDSLETSSCENNAFLGDMHFHGTIRRNSNLSATRLKDKCYEMDIVDEEVMLCPNIRSNLAYFDTMNDQESAGSLSNMFPEQSAESSFCKFHCDRIEDNHMKAKEAVNSRRIEDNLKSDCILAHHEFQMSMPVGSLSWGLGKKPYSSYSTVSNDSFYGSAVEMTKTMPGALSSISSQSEYMKNLQDFGSHCCSYFESELPMRTTIHSLRSHDIFEDQGARVHNSEPENKVFEDCPPERKDIPLATYSVPKEAGHCCSDDEEWLKKTMLTGQYATTALREGVDLDYSCAHKKPKNGVLFPQGVEELWQYDLEQFKKQLEVLEDDRMIMKQEDSKRVEEQLKLLGEISAHLSVIHSYIKRPLKKYCCEDDTSVVSVMEAMLSFLV